jgi:hypothetical protein
MHALLTFPLSEQRRMTPLKGMNGLPTSRSIRSRWKSMGSPSERELYGDGTSIVVRERESRSHVQRRQRWYWRREAGVS